jgi:hypothetical protein
MAKIKKKFERFTTLSNGKHQCNGCGSVILPNSWTQDADMAAHAERCMQLHMKEVVFRKNNK